MSEKITTCDCGDPAYGGNTQCSFCSTMEGMLAPPPAPYLPDVPYSGLEQRFFQGLNTITRRAVLQVLGGHTDAFMEQVRNRGDERRLFKHLFKAAPVAPVQELTNKEIDLAIALGKAQGTLRFIATVSKDKYIAQKAMEAAAASQDLALGQSVAVPDGALSAAIKYVRSEERRLGSVVIGGKEIEGVGLSFLVQQLGYAVDALEKAAVSAAQGDAKVSAPAPAAGKKSFTKGDTFPSGDCGNWQSGIHRPLDNHYQAIVCYGANAQEADARRDQVLEALLAPSTGYAKFGYILEAADGHQTWLKGDPADGMGRYGKIIQLYRKGGA